MMLKLSLWARIESRSLGPLAKSTRKPEPDTHSPLGQGLTVVDKVLPTTSATKILGWKLYIFYERREKWRQICFARYDGSVSIMVQLILIMGELQATGR